MIQQIKKELNWVDKELNKSFEEFVKEALFNAEINSYYPYEEKSKEELQIEAMNNIAYDWEIHKRYLFKRGKELSLKLEKAQKIEGIKTTSDIEIEEEYFDTEEVPENDVKYIINLQLRDNYIKIENHYKVNESYNVMDWLADADPENFLGFL